MMERMGEVVVFFSFCKDFGYLSYRDDATKPILHFCFN